jgi:hypothetical protein
MYLFIHFLALFAFEENEGVIWDYCKCLFLKQLSSFNYSFKSSVVITANIVCHFCQFFCMGVKLGL